MADSPVTETATPSATRSDGSGRGFSAVIALAYALAFALGVLLDAGRVVPMLERQAAASDLPWLRSVAGGLRVASEASGLAALSGLESRAIAAFPRERRIGSVPAPADRRDAASRFVAERGQEPETTSGAGSPSGVGGTEFFQGDAPSGRPADEAVAGTDDACRDLPAPALSIMPFSSPANAALAAFRKATGTAGTSAAPVEGAPPAPNAGRNKPRILLVGDSMMMEGFGPVLQRALRARPDVDVIREGKYSTGLSRVDYFDWGGRLAELVRRDAPDLVVICLGANDPQDIIDESGKRHHADSASWAEIYQSRAENLLRVATAGGARVIWVGLPIMSKEPYSTRIRRLSNLQKAACASYVPSGETGRARFVDTLAALADENGAYAAFAPDPAGRAVRLRYKDKVHVTEEGGRRMTRRVLPFIFAALGLPERLPQPQTPLVTDAENRKDDRAGANAPRRMRLDRPGVRP